uniref:Uncharacterized protein n=1 Tax=Triticum urartu TaxID=4572 RepID=A0A8R7RDG2_TRIUA
FENGRSIYKTFPTCKLETKQASVWSSTRDYKWTKPLCRHWLSGLDTFHHFICRLTRSACCRDLVVPSRITAAARERAGAGAARQRPAAGAAAARHVVERVHWRHDGHLPLQHPHHAAHGRPRRRLELHAPQRHLAHGLRLLPVRLPDAGGRGHDGLHVPLLVLVPHPLGEPLAALVLQLGVVVPAPPQDLEQHHAEAVHVALLRRGQRHPQLRRSVSWRPAPAARQRRHVRVLALAQPGQPEVRHLGREVGGEEDVGRLDVVVHDPLLTLLVEVSYPLGRADGDAVQRPPLERLLSPALAGAFPVAVEVLLQRAVLEVLVDERLGVGVEAEAVEPDEVHVVGPADGADLRHEPLLHLLVHGHLEHLHRHRQPVRELPLVDHPEAAGAELGGVVPGARRQLLRAEPHRLLVEDLVEELLHGTDLDHHIVHGS